MSEKWKSLPRKYCEACKCWFGDNKASLAHHEGGKNHKDNTAKFLKEVRARSAKKNAEEALAKKFFSKIDEKALKSFQKDVEAGIAKPLQYTHSKKEASQLSDAGANERSKPNPPPHKPFQIKPKVGKKSSSAIQIPPPKRIKSDPDARSRASQPYGQWVPVAETPEVGTQGETRAQPAIEPLEFTERIMDASLIQQQTQAEVKVAFNKPVSFNKVKRRHFRRTANED